MWDDWVGRVCIFSMRNKNILFKKADEYWREWVNRQFERMRKRRHSPVRFLNIEHIFEFMWSTLGHAQTFYRYVRHTFCDLSTFYYTSVLLIRSEYEIILYFLFFFSHIIVENPWHNLCSSRLLINNFLFSLQFLHRVI